MLEKHKFDNSDDSDNSPPPFNKLVLFHKTPLNASATPHELMLVHLLLRYLIGMDAHHMCPLSPSLARSDQLSSGVSGNKPKQKPMQIPLFLFLV